MNAALAVKVLEILEIEGVNAEVCESTGFGPLDRPDAAGGTGCLVDGAHNPGGIRAFIQAVKAQNGLAAGKTVSAAAGPGEQNAADMHPQIQPSSLQFRIRITMR